MAQKTVYVCDACGAPVPAEHPSECRVSVRVDRRMDAAGSMEDECEDADVCHRCALNALRNLSAMLRRGKSPTPKELLGWLRKA